MEDDSNRRNRRHSRAQSVLHAVVRPRKRTEERACTCLRPRGMDRCAQCTWTEHLDVSQDVLKRKQVCIIENQPTKTRKGGGRSGAVCGWYLTGVHMLTVWMVGVVLVTQKKICSTELTERESHSALFLHSTSSFFILLVPGTSRSLRKKY